MVELRSDLQEPGQAPAPFTLTRPSDVGRTIARGVSQATDAVLQAKEMGGRRKVANELDTVVNQLDEELGLNADIRDTFGSLENRQQALEQGRISRTAYLRTLDSEVRRLKKNNPGQELFIDARARQLLGQDPRIALRNLALSEQKSEDDNRQRVINYAISNGIAYLDDTGNVDEDKTVERVRKLGNIKAEQQLIEAQIASTNKKSGRGGSSSGGIRPEIEPLMSQMTQTITKEFFNRTDQIATQISTLKNPSPDEVNTIVFGSDSQKGALSMLRDLRQEMVERVTQSGMNFDERKEVLDYIDTNLFEPFEESITNKDFGLLGRQARLNKMLEENVVNNLNRIAPTIFALRAVGGEAYANKFVNSLDPTVLNTASVEGDRWLKWTMGRLEGSNATTETLNPGERRATVRRSYKQALELSTIPLDQQSLGSFVQELSIMDDLSETFLNDPSQTREFVNKMATPAVKDKLLKGKSIDADASNKAGGFIFKTVLTEYNSVASSLPPEAKVGKATVRLGVNKTTGDYELEVGDGKNNNVTLRLEDLQGRTNSKALFKVENSSLPPEIKRSLIEQSGGGPNIPFIRRVKTGPFDSSRLIRLNDLRKKAHTFREYADIGLTDTSQYGIAARLAVGNNLIRGERASDLETVAGNVVASPDESVPFGIALPSEGGE